MEPDIYCPYLDCDAVFDDPWRCDEHVTYDHDETEE